MSVIVVGAGPTGLMLAGDLAEAGVEVTVLEKRAEESNLTRAFALHARTLELFDMRGIADEIVGQGYQVPRVRATMGGREAVLDMHHPESRFKYVLTVQQARTEVLLQRRAERLGVRIQRGAEVTGLDQDEDGVTLTVRTGEGERTERATHVVGTDGAHSVVRAQLGVGFSGHSYDTHIILADVRLDQDLPRAVNPFMGSDGVALLPPYGDGWFRATVWDQTRQAVPLDHPVTPDELNESLGRITGGQLSVAETRWSTRFLSERRQADHYRVGRALLAGDAAHVHSPMGAMGMNTGIQDAANLAWKLVAVERGWAPPWLLDTYEDERHPVGRATLRLTDLILRMAVAPAPIRAIRPHVVPRLLRNRKVSDRVRRLMSGLGVRYDRPVQVADTVSVGQRVDDLPLVSDGERTRLYELADPTRFTLLDATEAGYPAEAAEPWADRVRALHVRAELSEGADVLLVRPDGYAAWSGERPSADQVRTALNEWTGSP
ncbi:FAD-dependent monooxygenase [Nocardiopsis exhalans]|uniref:FAD-dependent monooxygenase n=1 Tax=Nocardiopsis exhalans TaxID=163604 RepID=A0ABY5D390_9ACTN|nr:FAD-dependent monooxygenase [Nocardiopsis exhalans]USY18450.1 FAD-dependent monooxygenase [Nocardiopsis exhalans]